MQEVLNKLYFMELEENRQLAFDCNVPQYAAQQEAYNAFFNALFKEQKNLYLIYEGIRNARLCEENAVLYKCAFQSGFPFAQKMFTKKYVRKTKPALLLHKNARQKLAGVFNGLSVFV